MTQDQQVTTDSGIPLLPVYDESALSDSLPERLGRPGSAPFTRGPYRPCTASRLWTMRQYAGCGSAEDTNARFRYLLEQGQTALSVAFDLPTQLGLRLEPPDVAAEVGRVGVAIDTVDDMAAVFDGLPIDRLSRQLHHQRHVADHPGDVPGRGRAPGRRVRGHRRNLQNDILKEFLARKTYIFPPAPSIRLVADVVEYASRELPEVQRRSRSPATTPARPAATRSRSSGSRWRQPSRTRTSSSRAA